MEKKNRDYLAIAIPAVVLFFLTSKLVLTDVEYVLSDYNGHIRVYLPMFAPEHWTNGWMAVPYCLWHVCTLLIHNVLRIPVENAAGICSGLFAVFGYFVTYWMAQCTVKSVRGEENSTKLALVAFGLSVVQPLYFAWLNAGNRYLGPFSPNPMHNPTQMCVRGFSLLCFCLVVDLWGANRDAAYRGIFFKVENGAKKYYLYLAVVLLLSTFAKPTFAETFIPAVGFLMLGEWIAKLVRKAPDAGKYFKSCLTMLGCAVPALAYILVQFLAYFIWGGSYGSDGGLILTKPFEVWSLFTENVILSVALGMAFPILMILMDAQYYLRTDSGRLALASYAIGFAEAAFLGESGIKLSHADFIWPMMSGMLLMWTVCTLRLLILEHTNSRTKTQQCFIAGAWFVFVVHVIYGFAYLAEKFAG